MAASQHTGGRFGDIWRAVCRALAALGYTHAQQLQTRETWWQANRAAGPGTGPLTWVHTSDGYRLAGSHLPACVRRGEQE